MLDFTFPSTALLCFSPYAFCLRPLVYVSQSRIPGTVIPLCAAQCERMFNTTRTPGEESGKETDLYTHVDTHCGSAMFPPVSDTRYRLNMSN